MHIGEALSLAFDLQLFFSNRFKEVSESVLGLNSKHNLFNDFKWIK